MYQFRKFCVVAFFSLFCAQAFAQVNLTVRSEGTVNTGGSIPGVGSIASGSAYTMEISSTFPTTDQGWISWPNFYNAGNVPFTVTLTIDGTTHEINTVGQLNLGMGESTQGGVTYHLVNYNLSTNIPQGLLNVSTTFYLEPQGQPVTLIDLFDPSRGLTISPLAENVNSVVLYSGGAHTGLTGFPTSISYSTIGSPIAIVPEPSSYAMMIAGLALVAGMGRRGRSRTA